MIASISNSVKAIALENQYGVYNYHPLPVVLTKGEGVYLYDVEGNRYYDFLSAYSAVNQGHCHPRIIDAMINQGKKLTLTSRAFYNDKLGLAEKYICDYFGYHRTILMNSGAEAIETAIKFVRRWGYDKKGIPENEAVILVADQNFHGRTITIISASTDPVAKKGFGPFMPGFEVVPYGDLGSLETSLKNPNVCGFLVEPLQGEAGVVVPETGYLKAVAKLCKKHNALLMGDEIQTGLGRTGKMLASEHEGIKPDVLILGKAISGGVMPVSAVLSNDEVMLNINPGEHGSTFGGNPLACVVAMEALQIIKDEGLVENAAKMGKVFQDRMKELLSRNLVKEVRGKGLLNAVVINDSQESDTAWNICLQLKENGLLAKPTHGNKIRFAPPLIIDEDQMHECCDIIIGVISKF